jgi:hypothetical protein
VAGGQAAWVCSLVMPPSTRRRETVKDPSRASSGALRVTSIYPRAAGLSTLRERLGMELGRRRCVPHPDQFDPELLRPYGAASTPPKRRSCRSELSSVCCGAPGALGNHRTMTRDWLRHTFCRYVGAADGPVVHSQKR